MFVVKTGRGEREREREGGGGGEREREREREGRESEEEGKQQLTLCHSSIDVWHDAKFLVVRHFVVDGQSLVSDAAKHLYVETGSSGRGLHVPMHKISSSWELTKPHPISSYSPVAMAFAELHSPYD